MWPTPTAAASTDEKQLLMRICSDPTTLLRPSDDPGDALMRTMHTQNLDDAFDVENQYSQRKPPVKVWKPQNRPFFLFGGFDGFSSTKCVERSILGPMTADAISGW